MDLQQAPSWRDALSEECNKSYFANLSDFVQAEYARADVFPPAAEIFKAFERCAFDDVRVVILGQDPYHGPGQANGLCFSVREGVRPPPSLVNIFKEIENDLGKAPPPHGSLERWAEQGVLLLNATLTVRANEAGSHQKKGWEKFTDAAIRRLSERRRHIVYILWGAYAQKKAAFVDESENCIIASAHPSPLSARRGFFGSAPFSRANDYLSETDQAPIDW
ncbi:MAG: uracil-DNA glycosylase [Neomegalonema sp.]|nr:uracil-DNA glycosylase [Neomegalonema sp.]